MRDLPRPDAPPAWAGEAQLGYAASSGNSDTNNVNANLLISYSSYPWRHFPGAEVRFVDTNGKTNTERYAAGYKSEYFFSRRTFAFGNLSYDRDPFSDIESRWSATVGLGHALIDTERQTLTVQLGGGYRMTQFTDDTPDSDEPVARGAFNYNLQLTDNTSLRQDVAVMAGADNTFTESVTALQVSMTNNLSIWWRAFEASPAQTLKSAYCTGSVGRSGAAPASAVAYRVPSSRSRVGTDRPSKQM